MSRIKKTKNEQQLNTLINEPFDVYLSKKDFVSASDLKQLRKSPRHYWWYKNKPEEQDVEKKCLLVGSAMHHYILEPEIFHSKYACLKRSMLPVQNVPGGKATYHPTANKNFRDITFPQYSAGKTILDEVDYDLVIKSCESALKHDTIRRLFKNGQSEMSMYKRDEKTGLIRKGRVDRLPDDSNAILDIKSCMDASASAFSKDIIKLGYHIQAPQYLDLFEREKFLFIAIEKSDTAIAQIHLLSDEAVEVGRKEVRLLLDILLWCQQQQYWPDYSEFEILKMLYKENDLYDKGIMETIDVLNQFEGIKKETQGINVIGLPYWYKG